MPDTSDTYLICDLDGTLLKNDFFQERLIRLLLTSPFSLLQARKGLVHLKRYVLDDYTPFIDATINEQVVALIKASAPQFKKTLLISASPDNFVRKVGEQTGLFDECHGTRDVNLKAGNKLSFIREHGYEPYVYIGDSKADEILFKNAAFYYKIKAGQPILYK